MIANTETISRTIVKAVVTGISAAPRAEIMRRKECNLPKSRSTRKVRIRRSAPSPDNTHAYVSTGEGTTHA
eukprot:2702694-Rhodomonas_salina.1